MVAEWKQLRRSHPHRLRQPWGCGCLVLPAENATTVSYEETFCRFHDLDFLFRHHITLGCLILVLAVATDPFVQQVVAIKERFVSTEDLASMKICNASLYDDFTEGSGPGLNTLPLRTLGVLYSGFFQANGYNSKSLAMSCPTGNCTFEPYQSLGVCSRCADITEFLHRSERDQVVLGMGHYPYLYYTLPNGLSWNSSEYRLINTRTDAGLLRLDSDDAALIVKFTAITSNPDSIWSSNPEANARECMLYFCVKTYEAAVHESELFENQISTYGLSNFSSSYTESLNTISLIPTICYFNGTSYRKPYGDNEHCTYMVSPYSLLAMQNTISPLLHGTGRAPSSWRIGWSSDTIEAIYGDGGTLTDINTIFESIAAALTFNARMNVCKSTVQGKIWILQSYVHVRWQWLTLPVVSFVLSVAFLISTIVRTRNQYVWKSSPLALLFSELFIHNTPTFKAKLSLKEMNNTANKIKVWMETTSEGIKFFAKPNTA